MATVLWITGFLDFTADRFDAGVAFWRAVTASGLSAPRGERDQFATLLPPDGDAYLRVQKVLSGPGGVHIDLHVDDVPAAADRAERLGASRSFEEPGLVVLESPGGIGVCVASHDGEGTRPAPVVHPGGHRSLVDQVCLDIPIGEFDREADFWAALTGWERRPGALPEFDYLVRPDGMPLRLLLQRVQEPATHRCRAHLDLRCDDVEREVARHSELGATFVRRTTRWTTLTDPAGLPYCVTDRTG